MCFFCVCVHFSPLIIMDIFAMKLHIYRCINIYCRKCREIDVNVLMFQAKLDTKCRCFMSRMKNTKFAGFLLLYLLRSAPWSASVRLSKKKTRELNITFCSVTQVYPPLEPVWCQFLYGQCYMSRNTPIGMI